MISQQTIDEIRANVRISDVVSERVSLSNRSGSMVGLCPFHNESTPSFYVHDAQNYFHCFGCGESGDAIKFVMETQGMSFPDAVEYLAARFGIAVKRTKEHQKKKDNSSLKQDIFKANMCAAEFFMQSLTRAPDAVRHYLEERQLNADTCKHFSIGYAPTGWHALEEELRKAGIKEEVSLAAGLLRRNSKGGLYDMFRGRLMFPIFQDARHICGFGGREIPGLQDSSGPKYLNTGETPVYQKSRVLFGLSGAVAAMRETRKVYMVEGYMDVIGLHQVGIHNAVATCGTALTNAHVERLKHGVDRVVLLFDGDAAGRKASARSFECFLNSGIDGSVQFLPDGEDPDSFAKTHGRHTKSALQALESHSLLSCAIQSSIERLGAKSLRDLGAATKARLVQSLRKQLSKVQNQIEHKELLREASALLMYTEEELEGLLQEDTEHHVVTEAPETSESTDLRRCAIKQLPTVDRELLFVIMALRDEVTGSILSNGDMCQQLHDVTRGFVEQIHELLGLSESEKKEAIKELLKQYGSDWVSHWKRAHAMKEADETSLRILFDDCRHSINLKRIDRLIKELQLRIAETSGDEQARLSTRLLSLVSEKQQSQKSLGPSRTQGGIKK